MRAEDAGRHRHAVTVRADGLAAVLDPLLLRGRGVTAAALVDVDSGMVLDAWPPAGESDGDGSGAERWAVHAELLRVALRLAPAGAGEAGGAEQEVVVRRGDDHHHVVALVADPHGGLLGLAVEVHGSRRVLDRARRRMRAVSRPALTAGPTTARRPRDDGGWGLLLPGPERARPDHPGPDRPGPERPGPDHLTPEHRAPDRRRPNRLAAPRPAVDAALVGAPPPGSLFDPVRAPLPRRVVVIDGVRDDRPAPPSALPPPRR